MPTCSHVNSSCNKRNTHTHTHTLTLAVKYNKNMHCRLQVMLTFLEFYECMLQFVNFKLYHSLGVRQ